MRLIPYIRVSTDDQATHGHSVAAQLETIQRHAAQAGHFLLGAVTDEGVSGGRALRKRVGGDALSTALQRGDAEGVIVTRLDRLFRDLYDALSFFRFAARRGWVVVSVAEAIDTATPQGRLMLNMMLATAQYERELASARTAAVVDSLRKQGRVYGVVPYGCVEVAGRLIRDAAKWQVREQIVQWYQAQRYSLRTIARMLCDLRVPAPAGGVRWGVSSLRGVIESHASLLHLPTMTASEIELLREGAPETTVSRGAGIGHNDTGAGVH